MEALSLYIIPSLILIGALITDLRSRKIYNKYLLPCAVIALAQVIYFFGLSGLPAAFASLGMGVLVTLPLVLVGVLGAGDMKLFAVFGLATSITIVLNVVIAAFVWAAVFGIIYSLVNGSFKKLVTNMGTLSTGGKASKLELHQIPFTLPIFIGWLTYLAQEVGVL